MHYAASPPRRYAAQALRQYDNDAAQSQRDPPSTSKNSPGAGAAAMSPRRSSPTQTVRRRAAPSRQTLIGAQRVEPSFAVVDVHASGDDDVHLLAQNRPWRKICSPARSSTSCTVAAHCQPAHCPESEPKMAACLRAHVQALTAWVSPLADGGRASMRRSTQPAVSRFLRAGRTTAPRSSLPRVAIPVGRRRRQKRTPQSSH